MGLLRTSLVACLSGSSSIPVANTAQRPLSKSSHEESIANPKFSRHKLSPSQRRCHFRCHRTRSRGDHKCLSSEESTQSFRRMAGKPSTTTPSTYSPSPNQKKRPPLFKDGDLDWVRPDGRGFHQCRPAFFRTGAVNAAAGSAYAEFGNTKVIVSVFGPRESKKAMMYSDMGRLNCNVSYTTFAGAVRGQVSDQKEYSSMLHKALDGAIRLETFPKTTVDVFALVLESGGSDFPVVISCASLALADAGIMLYDLVAAVSVSCLGPNLVIDPISEEESYQDGSLVITCMPSRYEVTQLTITGEWSSARINEAMQLCLDACSKLGKVMRSCLKEAALASEEA